MVRPCLGEQWTVGMLPCSVKENLFVLPPPAPTRGLPTLRFW